MATVGVKGLKAQQGRLIAQKIEKVTKVLRHESSVIIIRMFSSFSRSSRWRQSHEVRTVDWTALDLLTFPDNRLTTNSLSVYTSDY